MLLFKRQLQITLLSRSTAQHKSVARLMRRILQAYILYMERVAPGPDINYRTPTSGHLYASISLLEQSFELSFELVLPRRPHSSCNSEHH